MMAPALAIAINTQAQLVDATQVTPTVPLGTITESLEEQIGVGRGDPNTPHSSIYFIKRDPARAIRSGRQLFQRNFTFGQGLGPRVSLHSTGNIAETPALGAGISDSCAGCHGRPKGSAGHGGLVTTRPDSRDAPHLFGLGLQEMLADEMTTDLRSIRQQAVTDAANAGSSTTLALTTKGISFGSITAQPDGTVDTSAVEGVNADLRVRPFFAQGGAYSMREFIIGAFKDEMGLEAWDPDLQTAGTGGQVTTPSGLYLDGSQDGLATPPVQTSRQDADGDGVKAEINPAVVDLLEFYLLNYFKPRIGKQTTRTTEGLALMDTVGCTTCHVKKLTIDSDRRVADVDTIHDPVNGIYNRLFATATPRWVVVEDGNEYPQVLPDGSAFEVDNFFSDLKRHDLGPAFHERNFDGTMTTHFVTEPLWGASTTAPYGHDGRSINLEEVILRHGGEAQGSRDAFAALSDDDQRKLIEYLQTLVLFPPDDTASNLNPGDKNGNPQDPANHGNINLGAVFQIADLGELPAPMRIEKDDNRRMKVRWYGHRGRTYRVQRSRDLKNWETIQTHRMNRGEPIEFEPNESERTYFYRIIQP